jgi:hypothetical protein
MPGNEFPAEENESPLRGLFPSRRHSRTLPVGLDGSRISSAGIRPDGAWVDLGTAAQLTAINDSGVSVGTDYTRAVSRAIRVTW